MYLLLTACSETVMPARPLYGEFSSREETLQTGKDWFASLTRSDSCIFCTNTLSVV